MKKIFKISLIFIIVLLTMLNTKVSAENSESLSTKIELVAPDEGVYQEGQEVTIRCTFNKKVKGIMPKYEMYFEGASENKIQLEAKEITELTNVVEYKYKIKSGDNGELKPSGFVNASECPVEDENGETWFLSSGFSIKFEKTILADTTIEWTDFSKAKIEIIKPEDGYNRDFNLILKDCTLKSKNEYYVHLSHEKNEEIDVKNYQDIYNNREFWQKSINTLDNKIYLGLDGEIFTEVGDVYATICEIDNDTKVPKIAIKSQKITKLSQLPLTQRITAYFFDDETDIFCWEPCSENQKTINYKIGQVTDINLLNALKNGEETALLKLMEYAKSAETTMTGMLKIGEDSTITDKLNLVEKCYYYVYLQLDTVNGKYELIEDVSLYQPVISEEVGTNLFSMTDKNFKWNIEETTNNPELQPEEKPNIEESSKSEQEEDTTTATVEIPKAGLERTIFILIIAISIISLIASKKCKKYRDII